ncbi:hypothetical protein [Acidovorax kalamii]|uniref:hypothetical protein n=1 Tax=Acidovorax kalamii TaxID=2004485 RepID=UPI00209062DC|nr:hypothetical protein [Acidovorax kalamii]MCO5358412.1 hypothetical protein [Acidovorax kalamii]
MALRGLAEVDFSAFSPGAINASWMIFTELVLAPEEFTYRLETRINAGFHVFDLEKYRQKYRHL